MYVAKAALLFAACTFAVTAGMLSNKSTGPGTDSLFYALMTCSFGVALIGGFL